MSTVTFIASDSGGTCIGACAAYGTTCDAASYSITAVPNLQTAAGVQAAFASMGLGTCTAIQGCDAGEQPLLGRNGYPDHCEYCPDEGWYTTNNCNSQANNRVRLCPCAGTISVHPPPPPPSSPAPPTPPPLPGVPPNTNLRFSYYDGYDYGISAGVGGATVLAIVTGTADSYSGADISGFSGSVLRDVFFDSPFGAQWGHERVVRAGYASASQPVWDIDLAARRVFLKQWASWDGVLYSSSRSTGLLGDPRVWAQSAPDSWQQPTATIAGDPHLTHAYGGGADFRGAHGKLYNLLSAHNVT
eukprot:6561444-Prymnesium_polylepis.1